MRRQVLIIDGHAGVRTALALRLSLIPEVQIVGAAATLEDAVRVGQQWAPDVVLYDPHTAAGDGATGLLALTLLGWPVVVLTAVLDAGEADVLWQYGAAGLVLKGRPLPVVLHALETALAAPPAAERIMAPAAHRWRAAALLDQLRAAAADIPGAQPTPRDGRPTAPASFALGLGASPLSAGGAAPDAGMAATRGHLERQMSRSARLIENAQLLIERSDQLCATARYLHARAREAQRPAAATVRLPDL